jgi:hypothetical protein
LEVADVYGRAENIEEKTVSNRVFQDGKRLPSIREGKEIIIGRSNAAWNGFQHIGLKARCGLAKWNARPLRASPRSSQLVRNPMHRQSNWLTLTIVDLPALLDRIADQMAVEFGFAPSPLQVVQFLAKKTGFSV